jgi:hypothetical protein
MKKTLLKLFVAAIVVALVVGCLLPAFPMAKRKSVRSNTAVNHLDTVSGFISTNPISN